MKRVYLVNGYEESRSYFMNLLGAISQEDYAVLITGGSVERNGNYFKIKNFLGL